MKIKVQWPNSATPTEYSVEEEQLRGALDYAIRNNEDFWGVVLDIAGHYQAERMLAAMKEYQEKNRRRAKKLKS